MFKPASTLLAALCLSALPCAIFAADGDAAKLEFFEKKIRPALAEHCYSCHSAGAKKIKGQLRVDSRSALLKGGESGPAIVPGNLDKSLFIEAILYTNQDLKMPPDNKLPEAIVQDFTAWIKAGAVWPDEPKEKELTAAPPEKNLDYEKLRKQHWAYQPVKIPTEPAVQDAQWPRGALDKFVLAKLEEKKLHPAAEAEKHALLRRVTFDLIGLPPTAEELDAFMNDTAPNAFEKVVDRLLASPHFGERWGRHWLDIARYAESAGGGRIVNFGNAWRYRDYVIESFNHDRPYNEFLKEQLAGDLQPAPDFETRRRKIVATGFLAIGPKNLDTQDKELLRMDVVDEQIDTVGKAVLGMTTGCARCHDHKFDPIPTKDYYALAGIFRSTKTLTAGNVSGVVQAVLPDAQSKEKIDAYEKQLAALDDRYNQLRNAKGLPAAAIKGEPRKKAVVTQQKHIHLASTLPGIIVDDSQANLVGTWIKSTALPAYVGDGYVHDNNKSKGENSVVFSPTFPKAGTYEVRFSYTPSNTRAENVPIIIQHADGETTLKINEKLEPNILHCFVTLGKFKFHQGNDNSVTVSNADTNGVVTVDAVQFIPVEELAESANDKKDAAAATVTAAPAPAKSKADEELAVLKQIEKEIETLKKNAPAGPSALAVKEEEQTGDCNLCIRGDAHKLGEVVPRGFLTLASWEPAKIAANQSGRLELAEWLASAQHPLTARVFANRVWQHLIGVGLVRSADNFGITGDAPTHPELLDYLASDFVRNQWSVKALIREIALSSTYRQAVAPNSAASKIDPENRLLWRANRRRLEVEAIRDAILLNAGQLDLSGSPGAPKVEAKAAKAESKSNSAPDAKAAAKPEVKVEDKPEPAAKPAKAGPQPRSVYLPLSREELNDFLEVFDFADNNLVVGTRSTSNIPTQALFLLNSPFVMEHATHAAKQLLAREGLDDAARLNLLYIHALGRTPSDSERKLALKFLQNAGGDSTRAWTQLCQSLFACVDFRYLN